MSIYHMGCGLTKMVLYFMQKLRTIVFVATIPSPKQSTLLLAVVSQLIKKLAVMDSQSLKQSCIIRVHVLLPMTEL